MQKKTNSTFLHQIEKDDIYLTTPELAKYLKLSTQWLEIGRSKGYGPPFVRLTKRMVRYSLSEVHEWMRKRSYASTTEADMAGV
jgi:predicted DNA-binding transcriptional regulator AlpA